MSSRQRLEIKLRSGQCVAIVYALILAIAGGAPAAAEGVNSIVGIWELDNSKWPKTVQLQFTEDNFGISMCSSDVGGSYRVVHDRVILSPEIVSGGRACSPLELDEDALRTFRAMKDGDLHVLTVSLNGAQLLLRDRTGRSLTFQRAK